MMLVWMWPSDPPPLPAVRVGKYLALETSASGSVSHSYWAMLVVLATAAALYLSFLFSYVFLWTVSPAQWTRAAGQPAHWPLLSAALFVASSGLLVAARGALRGTRSKALFNVLIALAATALVSALSADTAGHWFAGLRPSDDAFSAMVYMNAFLQFQLVAALAIMAGFAIARSLAGRLDRARPAVFDNLALLWHYTVGQALAGLLLVHGAPHLLS
jgi:cytochrome c oxidase subunit I+III